MKCPFCGGVDFKVTDSRNASEMNAIKRRRECVKCSKRFTTFETVDTSFQLKKRNGSFEEFQIDKLIAGISSACRHTSVSLESVKALAHEIANDVIQKGERTIEAEVIGEMVMKRLRKLDSVAYIRFACVYKKFKDMDELMDAISAASLL